MRQIAQKKPWELSVVAYSSDGDCRRDAGSTSSLPEICVVDFTLHFLAPRLDTVEQRRSRAVFHSGLLHDVEHLAFQVSKSNSGLSPTLYCLGVTHSDLEEPLKGITLNWDYIPYPVGFKRGRLTAGDRPNRLHSFAKWQASRRRMTAQVRGHKTLGDKIVLECLRFLRRISAPR